MACYPDPQSAERIVSVDKVVQHIQSNGLFYDDEDCEYLNDIDRLADWNDRPTTGFAKIRRVLLACGLAILLLAVPCRADITRWDTGAVIPGTEGIDIVPGTRVFNLDLHFADLMNRDLSGIKFEVVHLAHAKLSGSDLTGTVFSYLSMPGVDFTGANLTRIGMSSLGVLALDGAIFTDANITEASLWEASAKGFTPQNLYSTANYKNKDLHGINWQYNQLTNWSLAGQNLSGGDFQHTYLWGTDFSGANLSGANMRDSVVYGIPDFAPVANFVDANITGATLSPSMNAAQLEQTRNYREDKLAGITLSRNWSLAGIDLSGKDLRGMILEDSYCDFPDNPVKYGFENANLSGANLTGLDFKAICLRGANLTGAIGYVDPNIPPPIPGDANLDGFFNSSDFVQVFMIGEYEDDIADNSSWHDGDWNGDSDFNSTDLVTAFQYGRYEKAPAAVAVPEPSTLFLVLWLWGWIPARNQLNQSRRP